MLPKPVIFAGVKAIPTHVLAWGIWIFLSLVWGSSFILIKKALVGLTPIQVALVRVFVAFLAFSPFIIMRFRKVPRKYWLSLALVGIFGNGLPAILYAIGQTKVLSASAGILNALTPIFTLILAVVVFGQRLKNLQIFGTVVGFIGAGLLFINGWDLSGFNRYAFLIALATVCYGTSVNIVGHRLKGLPPLTIAACSFILIGPLSTIGIATVDPSVWFATPASVFAVIALALFSTFIASILFYRLVHMSDPLFASSVSYFAPVIALLWGVMDGEALGLKHILALVFILGGVYMIRQARKSN
jgi:drug/metabolite transporter (DMT)-like permease